MLCDKLTNKHSQLCSLDEDDLKTALFVFQRKKWVWINGKGHKHFSGID